MAANGATSPDSTGREYPPRPILGVGGLIFDGPDVLLVQRAKPPGQGLWSIPGGAVEVGETIEQSLIREMAEEVGLEVRVGPLVEVVERIFRDATDRPVYHYVVLDYLCRVTGGRLAAGSDAAAVRFASPDQWVPLGLPQVAITILEKAWRMNVSESFQ